MPERGTAEIRKEIAAERQGLDSDLDQLQSEMRSLVPFVVGGVAVVALVTFRKGTMKGVRMIWKLV
jgi:hypothetical protein